jgi:hypothetical protein
MQRIAQALGVAVGTVHNDLEGFSTPEKPSRPKGGRPKGSRPKKSAHEKAVLLRDAGVSKKDIAKEVGIGKRMVDRVLEVEDATRAGRADPNIDPSTLSLSAQQKFDAAIRQYKGKLDAEFESRVRERVRQKVDEIILPHWREKIDKAKILYERRRGVMDKATFNLIWGALHPDSRKSISDARLAKAFDITKMELQRCQGNTSSGEIVGQGNVSLGQWIFDTTAIAP